MEQEDLITLIKRYLEAVARLSKALQEAYRVESLFLARQAQKIPRSAKLGEDGEFQFHGIGCSIDDGSTSVNFDFYGNGCSDGFDAWRLHTFAEDNGAAEDLALDTSPASLTLGIEELVRSGLVVSVEGSNLFKLASSA